VLLLLLLLLSLLRSAVAVGDFTENLFWRFMAFYGFLWLSHKIWLFISVLFHSLPWGRGKFPWKWNLGSWKQEIFHRMENTLYAAIIEGMMGYDGA